LPKVSWLFFRARAKVKRHRGKNSQLFFGAEVAIKMGTTSDVSALVVVDIKPSWRKANRLEFASGREFQLHCPGVSPLLGEKIKFELMIYNEDGELDSQGEEAIGKIGLWLDR
jgi:hypothetical protein